MYKARIGNIFVYGLTGMFVTAFVTMAITGIVSLMLFVFSPFAFADSIENNARANAQCLTCHGKNDFSVNRNGKKISLYVDAKLFNNSIHGTNACASCHNDLGGIPHKKAIYGEALARQVHARCTSCHDTEAKTYKNSVHGEAALMGKDTAYCQDCHGSHTIYRKQDTASLSYWKNVPTTCTKCHDGNVKTAYFYSFHGVSVKNGYDKSPNCVNCHGAHQILAPENPKSMVNPANTAVTCAQCHSKAAAGFAKGFEHRVPQDKENAFSMWVLYKIFIGLIMFDVFMSGSIILFELSRKFRAVGDHQAHQTHHSAGSRGLKH